MMIQHQSLAQVPGSTPWQERQLPYGLKMLAMLGSSLLLVAILVSGLVITNIFLPTPWATDALPLHTAIAQPGVIAFLMLLVASIPGLVFLSRYALATTGFAPSYGTIPSTLPGRPFEVRYLGHLWGRSLYGAGRIRFGEKHLTLRGDLKPGILVQVALVVAGALILLAGSQALNIPLLVGSILSVLPVLLVWFVGRKAITRDIPYSSISALRVKGCHVEFCCSEGAPQHVRLYVSSIDGERLYHELQPRFPAAVVGWAI